MVIWRQRDMVKEHSDKEETRWCHMDNSFQLAARVLSYAPFHRKDSTYNILCYTSCGAVAGTFKTVGCSSVSECLFMVQKGKKRNVLFNNALNTFYLRLYGIRHMVKDHSDSERGNPLLPHGLLFPISSKDSTYHTLWYTSRGALAETRNSSMGV